MARAKQSPTTLACVGMAAGMLLLSFAAILVVMTPTSLVAEIRDEGTGFLAEHASHFLGDSSRRLQAPVTPVEIGGVTPLEIGDPVETPVTPDPTGPTVDDVMAGFTGTMTTTRTWKNHEYVLDSSDGVGSGSFGNMIESAKSLESQSSMELDYHVEQAIVLAIPWFADLLVTLAISVCFAVCYHQCAVDPILEEYGTLADKEIQEEFLGYGGKTDDFKNPFCGCLGDFWVFIHTCLCPIVRMAHTNAVSDVCGYWESICCFSLCACLTGGIIGPSCLIVHWRMRVKEAMGLEYNCRNDCLMTFLCPGLSLCQQATAVDRKMGYVVTGCCDVTPTGF